jgi:hypothetical protein
MGRSQHAFDGVDCSPKAMVDIRRRRLDLRKACAGRIELCGKPRAIFAHDRELRFQVARVTLGLEALRYRPLKSREHGFEALQRQIDGLAHGWMPFSSDLLLSNESGRAMLGRVHGIHRETVIHPLHRAL